MSVNINRRLKKIEQQVDKIAKQVNPAECICKVMTVVFSDAELEAETKRKCPVHGERRGNFLKTVIVSTQGATAGMEFTPEEYRRLRSSQSKGKDSDF